MRIKNASEVWILGAEEQTNIFQLVMYKLWKLEVGFQSLNVAKFAADLKNEQCNNCSPSLKFAATERFYILLSICQFLGLASLTIYIKPFMRSDSKIKLFIFLDSFSGPAVRHLFIKLCDASGLLVCSWISWIQTFTIGLFTVSALNKHAGITRWLHCFRYDRSMACYSWFIICLF